MNDITVFFSFIIISIAILTFQGVIFHIAYAQLILDITYNAEAGGGNATMPLNIFHPQNITISKNGSVEWTNPTTGISYPHTVTFVFDSNLTLPNTNMFNSSINNNQDKHSAKALNGTLIGSKIEIEPAILPTVVSANKSINYLNPQSNQDHNGPQYNITGSEKFVNSGFIWPKGNVSSGFSNITAFTARFNQVGVYHFQCLIHPEMTGIVTVTPSPGSNFLSFGNLGK